MATNDQELEDLQYQIIVGEVTEQTKSGGLIWSQISPTQYKVTEIDKSQCADPFYTTAIWDAVISKTFLGTEELYTLDLARNTYKKVGVDSQKVAAVAELFATVERNIKEPRKNLTEAIRFYQQLANAYNAVSGPPFVLRPNADLDVQWLRVPATGFHYEKIIQPVNDHDSDSTYVYDTNMEIAKFGFEPLPDWAEDNYSSVILRMAVKNISGTQLIGAILRVEGQGVTTDSDLALEAVTQGSYVTVEHTWTRAFTKAEINNLHVQLGAMAPVNRVSAIELVVN